MSLADEDSNQMLGNGDLQLVDGDLLFVVGDFRFGGWLFVTCGCKFALCR